MFDWPIQEVTWRGSLESEDAHAREHLGRSLAQRQASAGQEAEATFWWNKGSREGRLALLSPSPSPSPSSFLELFDIKLNLLWIHLFYFVFVPFLGPALPGRTDSGSGGLSTRSGAPSRCHYQGGRIRYSFLETREIFCSCLMLSKCVGPRLPFSSTPLVHSIFVTWLVTCAGGVDIPAVTSLLGQVLSKASSLPWQLPEDLPQFEVRYVSLPRRV